MNLLDKLKILTLICLTKIEFRFFSFGDFIKQKKYVPKFPLKPYKLQDPSEIYNFILRFKRALNLSCLQLARAMSDILDMLDINHKFIIGTRFEKDSFKSHAWIECQDFKMESEGFREIYSYERS